MTLVPHLLNLFNKPTIGSTLSLVTFKAPSDNRKEIAAELRRQIIEMRS
ncbi:MAG TPA: hypothetical protein VKM56_01715 [Verrucomicrobiae bacterium]|nr:hypothetical protein [Verrucomicrobiae bacterium]